MNLLKYRIHCTTDSKDEFWWIPDTDPAPTICPTNSAHNVDSGSVTVVDQKEDNEVIIQEETTKTGGNYQAEIFEFNVGAGDSTKEVSISFPHDISILAAEWCNKTDFEGDSIEFMVGQDTVIGTISADVAASATVIDVSQSVIDNIAIGKCVKLDDGTNVDDCGRVTAVDIPGKKITVETATTNSFLSATPTNVKMTTVMLRKSKLDDCGQILVGESKIGGSHVPTNTVLKGIYYNDSASAKKLRFLLEYLY